MFYRKQQPWVMPVMVALANRMREKWEWWRGKTEWRDNSCANLQKLFALLESPGYACSQLPRLQLTSVLASNLILYLCWTTHVELQTPNKFKWIWKQLWIISKMMSSFYNCLQFDENVILQLIGINGRWATFTEGLSDLCIWAITT